MHEVGVEAMRQRDGGDRRPWQDALGENTRLQSLAVTTPGSGLSGFDDVHLFD